MATYVKDPGAVLDYGFDWSDWLGTTETISTSTWTIPTGITKISDSKTDTLTIIWISGGTHGTNYPIVNHIRTNANREDERTHILKVRNR